MLISALIALLLLLVVAWMTSGSWSPSRVRLQDLFLVFPVLAAVKLGLARVPTLIACFLTYWLIAFALVAWYIRTTCLETRPTRKGGSEV
jgi:hypothetical protein